MVRTGVGLEGFGDPSLLVDNETGRIFMFHAAGTKAGFFESGVGVEPADEVRHVDLSSTARASDARMSRTFRATH